MSNERTQTSIRPINLIFDLNTHVAGSVLYCSGNTKVLCQATISDHTPRFIAKDQGWLTAEYAMLPAATNTRNDREVNRGKVTGRTAEIQRLIGRSLRSCFDLSLLPNKTLTIDCDVLQADGGTRTAAINGGVIAAILACQKLQYDGTLSHDPLTKIIGAVSVGIKDGQVISDIDYHLDESCDSDINVVMCEAGNIIEIQGTAEKQSFSPQILSKVVDQAWGNIQEIHKTIRKAIGQHSHHDG